MPKLIVPRLVAALACTVDENGSYCLDNVDAGGVLVSAPEDLWFIAGILNGPVAAWVFERISKPFRGSYLSANKQFIAPLPIPPATAEQRLAVSEKARELQRLHTLRRDLLDRIRRRLGTLRTKARPDTWLFPGLAPVADREADAPAGLGAGERRAWARKHYAADLAARLAAVDAKLRPGASLDADLVDGELRLLADGVPLLDRIFLTGAEGAFVLAQWMVLASGSAVGEQADGGKLLKAFRTLAVPENPAVEEQVVAMAGELMACDTSIAELEGSMNQLTFDLYRLTQAEISLVVSGRIP